MKPYLLTFVFIAAPVLFTLGALGSWRAVLGFWKRWMVAMSAFAALGLIVASLAD